ncbi:MAG: hypothetical protein AAGB31_13690 [Bdellovibrio sp.]
MKPLISLALILLLSSVSSAAPANKAQKNVPSAKKARLGTSFKFDGSALRGKYQSSMNTAATVENDKLLEDLLQGRTQFEDRAAEEKERN